MAGPLLALKTPSGSLAAESTVHVSVEFSVWPCCDACSTIVQMSALHAYSYLLQALQALLCKWLERYAALLEPTDMEAAMRDEVDLVLASIMNAGLVFHSASMLRLLCSTQPVKMTSARMRLILSAYKPGRGFTLPIRRDALMQSLVLS